MENCYTKIDLKVPIDKVWNTIPDPGEFTFSYGSDDGPGPVASDAADFCNPIYVALLNSQKVSVS